jgi:hypothetical protein
MTDKQKAHFELINNSLWLLLKPYVKDEKAYKDVMSEIIKLCFKHEDEKDRYSDEWWIRIKDLWDCPEKFKKNQDVCGFGAEMVIVLNKYFETDSRKEVSNLEFYQIVSEAFIKEWERLRDEKT